MFRNLKVAIYYCKHTKRSITSIVMDGTFAGSTGVV
jgi:hypothetical protein